MSVTMLHVSLYLYGKAAYDPAPFNAAGQESNGGHSTGARRRQQAPLLPRGGGGLAQARAEEVHRASRLLRPESAGRPRDAAREHGAREALDRQGRAALADRGAAREEICPKGPLARRSSPRGCSRWGTSAAATACAAG